MGDETALEHLLWPLSYKFKFMLPNLLCLVTEHELYLVQEVNCWLETLCIHVDKVFLSNSMPYLIIPRKEDKEKEKEQTSFTLRSSAGFIYPAPLLTSIF